MRRTGFYKLLSVLAVCTFYLVTIQCANDKKITVYPGPAGISPSDIYSVKVNGIESFTYKSISQIDPIPGPPSWSGADKVYPPGYFDQGGEKGWNGTSAIGHTASFTNFSFSSGEVRIEIKKLTPGKIESCTIRPLRFKIVPEIKGNSVIFTINKPMKLSVEFNGDLKDKMFLFADCPEEDIPDARGINVFYVKGGQNVNQADIPEDARIIYLAAGVHDIGKNFRLKSNQVLYLEGGSFVYGTIAIKQAENVTVKGRGILCGRQFPHADVHLISGESVDGITIDGITMLESPYFNISVDESPASRNIRNIYKNLKIISWYFNTDGIHGGSLMKADDIFLMCGDDAFLMGDKAEQQVNNIVIWTLRGASLQFGWGGNGGGNSLLNNIDIIHYQSVAGESGDYIAAISGQLGGTGNINKIVLQNITIEDMDTIQNKFLVMRTGPNPWIKTDTKSSIANVIFRNLTVLCPTSGNAIFGFADQSRISNITFENLVIGNKVITNNNEANIRIGDYADDIVFKGSASSNDTTMINVPAFDAEKDFSIRQGNNQWYYQSWNNKYFIFMEFDGKQWISKGSRTAILPNGNMLPGKEDAVKSWIALYKGTIHITGTVKMQDPAGGDGIKACIVKSNNDHRVTIWPEKEPCKIISSNDLKGTDQDLTIDVESGDMIYFIVNRNKDNFNDETVWNPQISY